MYGRADRTEQVITAIEKAIGPPYRGTSELKWTKIRKHNVPMYKSLINALHPLMKSGVVRFHCLVIDSHRANHKEYNEGDRELGFTKYAFTLLYKFARIHAKSSVALPEFYVHLDNRGTRYSPEVTRITLNYRDAREHGRAYEAYKLVHFVESKDNRLVQAADLFTGAVAAAWNREHSATHKKDIIEFIERKWFLPSLALLAEFCLRSAEWLSPHTRVQASASEPTVQRPTDRSLQESAVSTCG